MSGAHVLKLQSYKGQLLTENEIILQKFFEDRDEEHRRKVEKKQRKSSLVNDFLQVMARVRVSLVVNISMFLFS